MTALHRLKRPPVGVKALALVGLLALLTGSTLVFAGGVFGSRDLPPDSKAGSVQEADLRDRWPETTEPALPGPTPAPTTPPVTAAPTTAQAGGPAQTARPVTVRATSDAPVAVVSSAAPPPPISIAYQDFASISGLAFYGSAGRSGPALRLTPNVHGLAGAVWSRTPIDTRRSFSTTFSMVIYGGGGDGLAFVLQSEGLAALGDGGGNLGYGGAVGSAVRIKPSIAIEFDVFDNSWDPATGHNHVAVTAHGDPTRSYDYGVPGFQLACGIAYNAWVDYDVTTKRLNIYTGRAGKPASPIASVTADLAQVLGTGSVYAGFTGSTGLYAANQDVLSWRLTQS